MNKRYRHYKTIKFLRETKYPSHIGVYHHMVRPDTSDSSTKAIHLGSRKAVDIWNKRRARGENLSEKFTNILLQEDENEQATNNNSDINIQEQENRIRPRLDVYFAVDPKHYKNMTRWRYFFSHAKPEEIADSYDMLEYSLRMLRPRASMYKEEQEAEKMRLYRQERAEQRRIEEVEEKTMLEQHEKVHKPEMYAILDDAANALEVNEERAKKYVESNIAKCSSCRKIHYETLQAEREVERKQEQERLNR